MYTDEQKQTFLRAQQEAYAVHETSRIKYMEAQKAHKIAYKIYKAAFEAYQTVYHDTPGGMHKDGVSH